ncbi:hypothetical protein FQN49_005476 [Arthroderma sp. PD_2]|nr:hypothetical protein FQN49_005476 [Arthroderma sp. PD_2]
MASPTQLLRLPLKGTLRLPRAQIQSPALLSRTALQYTQWGPSRLSPTSISAFSTRAALFNVKSPSNMSSKARSDAKTAASENGSPRRTPPVYQDPPYVKKVTRIFYVVVGVLAVAEIWWWCKFVWGWFMKRREERLNERFRTYAGNE